MKLKNCHKRVLGIPGIVSRFEPKKISKYFRLKNNSNDDGEKVGNKNKESISKFRFENIDTQKQINSVYETTLDYLLKHDASGNRARSTIERLASLNKGKDNGVLFDYKGRKVTTMEQIAERKKLLSLEKEKLQMQKQQLLDAIKNKNKNDGAGVPATNQEVPPTSESEN